jgi:hypothetical protein
LLAYHRCNSERFRGFRTRNTQSLVTLSFYIRVVAHNHRNGWVTIFGTIGSLSLELVAHLTGIHRVFKFRLASSYSRLVWPLSDAIFPLTIHKRRSAPHLRQPLCNEWRQHPYATKNPGHSSLVMTMRYANLAPDHL